MAHENSVRKLHANHLRKYVTRINSIGVLYGGEEEFGEVITCPTKDDCKNSEDEINNLDLSHLSESKAKQMHDLLL